MYRPILLAGVAASLLPHAVMAQTAPATAMPPGMGMPMDHAKMDHSVKDQAKPDRIMPERVAPPMAHHDMAGMTGMDAMPAMTMGMGGDAYQMGSGTARLPAAEGMMRGKMIHAGDWMLMAHGYAWGVVTDQGGPRGKSEAFVQSMAMLMADRDLGDRWHIQLRAMNSLEPLMGARGYTNLFATG